MPTGKPESELTGPLLSGLARILTDLILLSEMLG